MPPSLQGTGTVVDATSGQPGSTHCSREPGMNHGPGLFLSFLSFFFLRSNTPCPLTFARVVAQSKSDATVCSLMEPDGMPPRLPSACCRLFGVANGSVLCDCKLSLDPVSLYHSIPLFRFYLRRHRLCLSRHSAPLHPPHVILGSEPADCRCQVIVRQRGRGLTPGRFDARRIGTSSSAWSCQMDR